MNIRELDYKGVLPKEKEDRTKFVRRGEQFLSDAYGLQELLKKNPRHMLEQEKRFRKIKRVKDGEYKLVEPSKGFFELAYQTCPDWVSVVEAGCDSKDLGVSVLYGKSHIPIAIVNDRVEDIVPDLGAGEYFSRGILDRIRFNMRTYAGIKHHEIIHCVREPVTPRIDVLIPWRKFECASLEEHIVNHFTNDGFDTQHLLDEDKHLLLVSAFSTLGSFSLGATVYLLDNALPVISTSIGIFWLINLIRYSSSACQITPTRKAFDDLSGGKILDKPDAEQRAVQYALLRLKPSEIRKIADEKRKNNIDSLTATKNFLGKRKNLRSEIILSNIN